MTKLDDLILERYGVDTFQLAEECQDIIGSGTTSEYENVIQACATAIMVSSSQGDAQGWWGAALALFAIGYRAGRDAPDLRIFNDALKD